MFRIMIIEDNEDMKQELRTLLENALYEVCLGEDFLDIPRQVQEEKPDLILLDMNLPGASGLSICSQVRKMSQVPIIFVTGSSSPMDELNGMLQGGDDYVTKPYQAPILLARIAAVLKRSGGRQSDDNVIMKRQGVQLHVAAAMLEKEGQKAELTRNELKILFLLFEKAGSFISREELVDSLWDQSVFIDDNTLSVNMSRIRSKLEQLGAKDFIETKRGLGYKIV